MSRRSDLAYKLIRENLLAGAYQAGQLLSTQELASKLGMSRTPVAEALQRLSEEGFLERLPQVGFRVVVPTPQEILEVFTIRAVLEGLAAELAAERLTAEELRQLEGNVKLTRFAVASGNAPLFEKLNRHFHLTITQAAGSPKLARLLENLWTASRYRVAALQVLAQRMATSHREHEAILDALRERDGRSARQLLEQHLRTCSVDFANAVAETASEVTRIARRRIRGQRETEVTASDRDGDHRNGTDELIDSEVLEVLATILTGGEDSPLTTLLPT